MNKNRDLLELFKEVALRVDKRALPHVMRSSKIGELGIDSLSGDANRRRIGNRAGNHDS
jgi:hypothetical protein